MTTVEIPDELVPEGFRAEYRPGAEIVGAQCVQVFLALVPTTKWRDAQTGDVGLEPRKARFRTGEHWVMGLLAGAVISGDGQLLWWDSETLAYYDECQVQVPADEREPREWWYHAGRLYLVQQLDGNGEPELNQIHVREVLP